MNLLPISDLHVEFHPDDGRELLCSLPTDGVDVCVVAGDLSDYGKFEQPLQILAERYPHVVFVHGNHECYGASLIQTKSELAELADKLSNLHFLDNRVVNLDDKRFVGTTMWFRPHPKGPAHADEMSDFWLISNFRRQAPAENEKAVRFLTAEVQPGDIVVTHHAPCWRSEDPRWKSSPVSRLFYVCDMNDLIFERQPAVWIHGHVHRSWDYPLWNTRIVCNPFGYMNDEPNREFSPRKILKV